MNATEPSRSTQKRRWLRLILWMLFAFVLAVCLGLTWFFRRLHEAEEQKRAVEALAQLDVKMFYRVGERYVSYEEMQAGQTEPQGPVWLRRRLGDDFFDDVVEVWMKSDTESKLLTSLPHLKTLVFFRLDVTDAALENLGDLDELASLRLETTSITDQGLKHLSALPQLEELGIWGARSAAPSALITNPALITDSAIAPINDLAKLRQLTLRNTNVTDAGLSHLKNLTRIEGLFLGNTNVSDVSLANVKGSTRLRRLGLGGTGITDAGLAQLSDMRQLEYLDLQGTAVSDAGLQPLRKLTELQNLNLSDTDITDVGLEYLYSLTSLRELALGKTKVTDAGIRSLQKALPFVRITK